MGRSFSEPSMQDNMKFWPFRVISKNDIPYVRVHYQGAEKDFSPIELCAILLAHMKEMAEEFLGEEVENVVISIPSKLTSRQRQTILEASAIAGLNPLRLIHSPSAASLAFSSGFKSPDMDEEETILIFDMGGGSVSVSLVCVENGVHQVKASAGTSLGGWDFDKRMMAHVLDECKRRFGKDFSANSRVICRLLKACESAKRTLSSATVALIELDCLFEGRNFTTTITRKKFTDLCDDLFQACLDPVKSVLQDAQCERKKIIERVMVGGSSRIPKIAQLLEACLSGRRAKIISSELVANGAAYYAAMLSFKEGNVMDTLLVDVTSSTLGIENEKGEMVPVIKCNSNFPCRTAKILSVHPNTQHSITVKVYEGPHSLARDNVLLGILGLSGFPLTSEGAVQVEVTFEFEFNDFLRVSAEELSSKTKHSIIINRGVVGQSGEMSEEVRKLKSEQALFQAVLKKKEEESLCVVCEDKPINVVLVPCGHQIMCADCSSQQENRRSNTCPSCRANVTTRVKTFGR
eukprot:Phypoly_transcript_03226.p1 GENE.Phypoly_transcript_03226~~Phypoly_transcript_03226.p1  ORF type:complete len:573 (+),score=69.27 Phypoly_transcript_03226:161-1720(+)